MSFRWLKPILTLGLTREININDIYATTNDMRSDKNTEAFSKQWQLELEKKNPNFLRVLWNLYGYELLIVSVLSSILSSAIKYVSMHSITPL